jgi:hypothetical protein
MVPHHSPPASPVNAKFRLEPGRSAILWRAKLVLSPRLVLLVRMYVKRSLLFGGPSVNAHAAPAYLQCRAARALAYCVRGSAAVIDEVALSSKEAKHPTRAALRFGAPSQWFLGAAIPYASPASANYNRGLSSATAVSAVSGIVHSRHAHDAGHPLEKMTRAIQVPPDGTWCPNGDPRRRLDRRSASCRSADETAG